jgi:hypothetical protein
MVYISRGGTYREYEGHITGGINLRWQLRRNFIFCREVELIKDHMS